jgi:membrane protein
MSGMDTLKGWWARAQQTDAWRAWKRYGDSRGSLLAGGVTYFGFLSIFPILALAFAVAGFFLRGNPDVMDSLRQSISDALPGFIKDDKGNGLIPLELPGGGTLTTIGVVGVAGLLWGGLGWLSALRDGIRAIFGVEGAPGNFLLAKLRDLGVLFVLGIGVLVSAVVAGVAQGAAGWIAGLIGLGSQGWLVTLVGLLVQTLLNTGVMALVLRVLSGVALPWPGLRKGAVFGGIGLTLIQTFGTRLIAGTMSNPVFASIAVVVGLLVFLNFISRVILVSAAWAANDLDAANQGLDVSEGRARKLLEGPEAEPLATARERTDAGLPTFGQKAADRTTLAAGAVLGATGAMGLGALARGIRALVFRGRR